MKTTSRLLINEHPLQVLPTLATCIWLNEAVFLQQVHYWTLGSQNVRDGRRWVYNTYEDWQKQFPFWSVRTLKRVVNSLRDKGLIVTTSEYNKLEMDKTLWYSIDYEALDSLDCVQALGQNDTVDVPPVPDESANLSPSSFQSGTTYNQETTTEIEKPSVPMALKPISLVEICKSFLDRLEKAPPKERQPILLEAYHFAFGKNGDTPSYGYIGKAAKEVGGAGRLVELMIGLSTRPPVGDKLAYIIKAGKQKDNWKSAREVSLETLLEGATT
jgi:hypothetical protein